MELKDFKIGLEFKLNGKRYRCTDVGSRTVIAIRIDQVQITETHGESKRTRVLGYEQAHNEGWFNGPPFALAEHVFDEDDIVVCC